MLTLYKMPSRDPNNLSRLANPLLRAPYSCVDFEEKPTEIQTISTG
jgi:hypothetical protein